MRQTYHFDVTDLGREPRAGPRNYLLNQVLILKFLVKLHDPAHKDQRAKYLNETRSRQTV